MAIRITRVGAVVSAADEGLLRAFECRNVRSALELEIKLTSDAPFADWWALQTGAMPPKPHDLER